MCMYLEMMNSCIPLLGHCDLDLVSRIGIESGAYLLYSLSTDVSTSLIQIYHVVQ